MVTIQDVAHAAGVSVSTVSRVLNNSFTVTEDKRKRVLDAVEEVGYQATRTRSEKSSHNKIILVVTSYLQKDLFESLRDTANEFGYSLLFNYVGDSENAYQHSAEALRILKENVISGIILVNTIFKDEKLKEYFGRFPLVQIGEAYSFSPCYVVNTDDYKAGYDITSYLIRQGYREIGFVGLGASPDKQPDFSQNRLRGYRNALKDAGLAANLEWIVQADYSLEGGADSALLFYGMDNRPNAICFVSDIMAAGCINECKHLGLRVPEDIAIAGFDNAEYAEICSPAITTVAQSFEEIGTEAVRMLDMVLRGNLQKGRRVYINHEIIQREST